MHFSFLNIFSPLRKVKSSKKKRAKGQEKEGRKKKKENHRTYEKKAVVL